MVAAVSDVARFTRDGTLVTKVDAEIRRVHQGAIDGSLTEHPTFFDSEQHTDFLAAERFSILSMIGRCHEAVEVTETIGLGSSIPLGPFAPQIRLTDHERLRGVMTVPRAYSFDHNTSRYAIELTGIPAR